MNNKVTLTINETVTLVGQNMFNINGTMSPDLYFLEKTKQCNRCVPYNPQEIKECGESYLSKRNDIYFNTPISKILFVTIKLRHEQYGAY